MKILDWARKIKKSLDGHEPLITIEVGRASILHNLRAYRRLVPNLQLAVVLKSNAYGHGLVEVASIIDGMDSRIDGEADGGKIVFMVVDSLYEARVLRARGIKSAIVVVGFTSPKSIAANKLRDVAFTVTSMEQLRQIQPLLSSAGRAQDFHLKVDTGMHRQGLAISELAAALEIFQEGGSKNGGAKGTVLMRLQGLCSHLADADGPEQDFTLEQIKVWNKVVAQAKAQIPEIKFFHLSATAGLAYADKIDANVGRLGLGLYGINASPFTKIDLKPALQMSTIITSVREIAAGEHVGYNITYTANSPRKIATVPVGYFEGVGRRLSNKGFYKIHGKFAQIVGRVSMNISCCDVTDIAAGSDAAPAVSLNIGEPVIVISAEKNDPNSAENMAKAAGTIAHEILVHLPQHIRRVVV